MPGTQLKVVGQEPSSPLETGTRACRECIDLRVSLMAPVIGLGQAQVIKVPNTMHAVHGPCFLYASLL